MRRSFAYAFVPGRNEYLVRLVFLAGEESFPAPARTRRTSEDLIGSGFTARPGDCAPTNFYRSVADLARPHGGQLACGALPRGGVWPVRHRLQEVAPVHVVDVGQRVGAVRAWVQHDVPIFLSQHFAPPV